MAARCGQNVKCHFKNGRRIADLLLEFLSTGEFPSDATISARYVPDETFPRR